MTPAATLALIAPASPVWFFARAAGFVSLLLLTASVCLGILLTMRLRSRAWPLFLSDELHGYTALVFFIFVALHIVTVLLDPFTKFGLTDVLVPFVSTYRRVWLGLGVLSFELTLALGLSVYVRRYIGYRAWRVLHYATYAILPMALVHGLATGSDSRTSWGVAIYGLCTIALGVVVVMRLVDTRARVRGPFAAAGALSLLTLASWAVTGPMHAGWARTAGTPQLDRAGASPSPAATAPPLALVRPFVDRASGRVDSQSAGTLKASGQATGNVDLGWTLDATQDAAGGATGTLKITAADGTGICVATLDGVSGQGFLGTCAPAGAQGSVRFALRLRQRPGGILTGALAVSPGDSSAPSAVPSPSPSAAI